MTTYQRPTNPQNNAYANRYQRNGSTAMDRIFSLGPYIVAIVSFLVAVASIVSLILVDIIAGKYIGDYMSPNNETFGLYWTFATTGIPLSLIGAALYGYRENWGFTVVGILLLIGLVPAAIDCWYDGLAGDIIRFNQFIDLNTLADVEKLPHNMFRIMLGFTSAIGEPLAAMSVIVFPLMRELFRGVFSNGN